MENNRGVNIFLKNYINERNKDGNDLVSFLSPVAKTVELLSFGGAEFVQSLNPENVYHYSMLILDVAKLSLGVQSTEINRGDLPRLPSDVDELILASSGVNEGDSADTTFYEVPLCEPPERSNQTLSAPAPNSNSQRQQSMLDLIGRSIRRDLQETPIILPVGQLIQSTPLSAALGPSIPSQSTPLRPDSFPMPSNIGQDQSMRYSSIPRHKPTRVAPPLPVIRDNQTEHHRSDSSQASTVRFQVRDYARRSLQEIQERRAFDEPLQDSALEDLPVDQNLIDQMEELFAERRRLRTEHRIQCRREILPEIPKEPPLIQAQVITIADRISEWGEYLFVQSKDGCVNIENFLAKLRSVTDVPDNIHYRVSTSIDPMRAGDTGSRFSAMQPTPLQQSQQSTAMDFIVIRPEITPGTIDPSIRSPQPQSIIVPDFVERLIDTDPIIPQPELRPLAEIDYLGMASRGTRPPRRKRRKRNPQVIADVQEEIISSSHLPGTPRNTNQGAHALTLPLLPDTLDFGAPIGTSLPEEDNAVYYKKKFEDWRRTLMKKANMKTPKHRNDLSEIKRMESLCRETQNLLALMSAQAHLSMDTVIPPGTDKKNAAQRFAILLELNTRSMIALQRDSCCSVIGVENMAFNAPPEAFASTSQQHRSKGAKESGFSEGMFGTDTQRAYSSQREQTSE